MTRPFAIHPAAAALALWLLAPAASAEHHEADTALAPCPDSPNCVSSLAPPDDEEHHIAAFDVAGDAAGTWQALREAVLALPRTEIVAEDATRLHAESTSRIFRWVDDLELHLDVAGGRIDVRSASRTGYGDMGVNRARVETLREALEASRAAAP